MTWFKVDDSLAFHPKVIRAGEAMALWLRAGSWCAQQLTDGHVPSEMVPLLGGQDLAERLVKVGLWDEVPDGFQFHDWDGYQPSREDVLAEREAARERMRDVRKRRKGVRSPERSGEQPPNVPENVRENFGGSSGDVRLPRPDPSRPDLHKDQGGADAPPQTPPRKRATRLPDGWKPDRDLITAMAQELGRGQEWFTTEHRKFTDHWKAAPDDKARKADWDATWRNWMRRAAESPVRAIPQAAAPVDRIWRELGVDL